MIQIDMEMPEKCSECEFEYDLYGQDGLIHGCYIQGIGETDAVRKNGRLPSCPLIDVPDMNVGNITKEQPEIIRCKDCAYVDSDATCFLVCGRKGMGLKPYHVYHDDYCSYAERKTDATD